MKLNPQEIGEILEKHLDELTTEEFISTVKEFCPYLFTEDNSYIKVTEKELVAVTRHQHQEATSLDSQK